MYGIWHEKWRRTWFNIMKQHPILRSNDFYMICFRLDEIVSPLRENSDRLFKLASCCLCIIPKIPCAILTYFIKVKGIFPRNGTVKPGFEERSPLIFHSDRSSLIVLAYAANPWICCLENKKRKRRLQKKKESNKNIRKHAYFCLDIYCTASNSFHCRLQNFGYYHIIQKYLLRMKFYNIIFV